MISRSSLPVIFLLCFGLVAVSGVPAHADTQAIVETMQNISQSDIQKEQAFNKSLENSLKEGFELLNKADTELYSAHLAKEKKPATMNEALPAMSALPSGLAVTDQLYLEAMGNRYRELNRVPMPDNKAQYMLDTSWTTPVNMQAFDIFMRYFCDPKSSAGRMEKAQWKLADIPTNGDPNGPKRKYTLGCGYAQGDAIETRHGLLGKDDTTEAAQKIIALPLRPSELFFTTTTFPTLPSSTNPKQTNTSKVSEVYFGAFAQSLQFLLGSAPDNGGTIAGKTLITRNMLASIPFAILFSERAGSMGSDAAKSLERTLRKKLSSTTSDPAIESKIQNLKNRNNVSVAEYMDIMMYQLPTSPGYYQRITSELSVEQLRREEVWLTAMQTAVNYQRNRWLELQAALEAVK